MLRSPPDASSSLVAADDGVPLSSVRPGRVLATAAWLAGHALSPGGGCQTLRDRSGRKRGRAAAGQRVLVRLDAPGRGQYATSLIARP